MDNGFTASPLQVFKIKHYLLGKSLKTTAALLSDLLLIVQHMTEVVKAGHSKKSLLYISSRSTDEKIL